MSKFSVGEWVEYIESAGGPEDWSAWYRAKVVAVDGPMVELSRRLKVVFHPSQTELEGQTPSFVDPANATVRIHEDKLSAVKPDWVDEESSVRWGDWIRADIEADPTNPEYIGRVFGQILYFSSEGGDQVLSVAASLVWNVDLSPRHDPERPSELMTDILLFRLPVRRVRFIKVSPWKLRDMIQQL